MDPKPRPNDDRYVEILRRMTPEEKLRTAFELSEYANELLRAGLRAQHPGATEKALHQMYLARLAECHNKNY